MQPVPEGWKKFNQKTNPSSIVCKVENLYKNHLFFSNLMRKITSGKIKKPLRTPDMQLTEHNVAATQSRTGWQKSSWP